MKRSKVQVRAVAKLRGLPHGRKAYEDAIQKLLDAATIYGSLPDETSDKLYLRARSVVLQAARDFVREENKPT